MWDHLAAHPLHLGCPSSSLLPVQMNVSSSTPWLLDFCTVWLSVSCRCYLCLNLLLSFFWLWEGGKVYLPMPPSSWPEDTAILFLKVVGISYLCNTIPLLGQWVVTRLMDKLRLTMGVGSQDQRKDGQACESTSRADSCTPRPLPTPAAQSWHLGVLCTSGVRQKPLVDLEKGNYKANLF